MKKIHHTLLIFLFYCPPAFAREADSQLMDFVLPVPHGFVTSAAEAFKITGKNIDYYFKALGIQFPQGAKAQLDAGKETLTIRLPREQALNVIQVIGSCVDETPAETAKGIFGIGKDMEGSESHCFGSPR